MPKTYRRRTHSKRRHRRKRAHRRSSTRRTRRYLGRQMGGCNCGMPSIPFFRGGEGVNTTTYLTPEKPARPLPPPETPMRSSRASMEGGSHRENCQCSSCKQAQTGGGGMVVTSSQNGISSPMPYPINSYQRNVTSPMIAPTDGLDAPFARGGRRRKRTQKGGNLTNFLTQDLVNVGRQIQFGMGSAYNALAGHSAPVNPLPWKDQFPSHTNFRPSTV